MFLTSVLYGLAGFLGWGLSNFLNGKVSKKHDPIRWSLAINLVAFILTLAMAVKFELVLKDFKHIVYSAAAGGLAVVGVFVDDKKFSERFDCNCGAYIFYLDGSDFNFELFVFG